MRLTPHIEFHFRGLNSTKSVTRVQENELEAPFDRFWATRPTFKIELGLPRVGDVEGAIVGRDHVEHTQLVEVGKRMAGHLARFG